MTKSTTYLLQISAGRGPDECQLATRKVADEILKTAKKMNLDGEIISSQAGDQHGTFLSALVSVTGKNSKEFCESWQGSIKWMCKSPYRSQHKRSNWFVGVEMVLLADKTDSTINVSDVSFETFGASGPGGQHTNKTDSAVRAKHLPTGHVVTVKTERSQHANKKLALTLLRDKISKENQTARSGDAKNQWQQHEQIERGNPVKVFTGTEFKERQTNV